MRCREGDGKGAYWAEPHPLDEVGRGRWQRCYGCNGTGEELFDGHVCGQPYAGYRASDGHDDGSDVCAYEQLERDGRLDD